jgi:tetratricopeptide (TPR) repeat protein
VLHGKALMALGKNDAGLAELAKALKRVPQDAGLAGLVVRSYLAKGKADDALAVLGGQQDSSAIFALRGEALLMKGEHAKALEALEAAVKSDATNLRALKLTGDLYAVIGSNDMALQYYGRAATAPAVGDDAKFAEDAKAARATLIDAMAKKAGN